MMEPTHAELIALWNACKYFVNEYEIGCVEQIWQTDSVIIAAPELVECVCEIVGYKEYEDDE